MKNPAIELSDCVQCGICVELYPSVFKLADAGYFEIVDKPSYDEAKIEEVIKYCPSDCVYWEDDV